jgi:hypothetical protein
MLGPGQELVVPASISDLVRLIPGIDRGFKLRALPNYSGEFDGAMTTGLGVQTGAISSITIDPVNGDDSATGSASYPIKTNAELARRIGNVPIKQSLTISYTSYPPATDPLALDLRIEQGTSQVVVTFQAPPLTVKKSGTIGTVTARDRSTNTPWNFADAGAVFDATDVGQRILIPTGPRAGTRTFAAKLLSSTSLRTSEWVLPDFTPGGLFTTPITPAAGDPYQILTAPGVMVVDHVKVSANKTSGFPNEPLVLFLDFDFAPADSDSINKFVRDTAAIAFGNCRFTGSYFVLIDASSDINNTWYYLSTCEVDSTMVAGGTAPGDMFISAYVDACLCRGDISADNGATIALTQATLVQGKHVIAQAGGTVVPEDCGVMDWNKFVGIAGGFTAYRRGNVNFQYILYGVSGMWGASASPGTVGVDIADGSRFMYTDGTKFFVTGVAGDFRLGGRMTGATYNTATGTFTENVATTWANLTGTPGLNNMHDIPHDAHAYKLFNL